MSSQHTQDGREASVTIAGLTKDHLLLKSMVGTDKVGQPFNYVVEMLRNSDKVEISKLVGKKLMITLEPMGKGKERYFHGIIADVRRGGAAGRRMESYYASVVPWFWFLKKSSRCRIFKSLTVNEILETIFKSFKFASGCYELKDLSDHPAMEHCVQYQETDFAFASRLMEEFGISYYFEHYKNKHIMVLLDSSGKRPDPPSCGYKEMQYSVARKSDAANVITRWEHRNQVVSDKYAQLDHNFGNKKKFPTLLTYEQEGKGDGQGDFTKGSFERYVYDGIFIDDGVSEPEVDSNIKEFKDLAKVRLGALQAEQELMYAESDCRGLHAGYEFKLSKGKEGGTDIYKDYYNKEYYVLSARHQIELGDYGTGSYNITKPYTCTITVIPKETEYYPPRLTPKARIYGPQTAVVVVDDDKKEKQVYTDKFGRIKIMFLWDRQDDRDEIDENSDKKAEVKTKPENLSCWVRVSQGWAGKQWGSFFLPRVGQEVIVEFLDGDPDRPIVTGSVYNGVNWTPYKLDEHSTISSIKSKNIDKKGKETTKDHNYNEIRFEDDEESAQIFIHAAKSMDKQILGDHREYVGCNVQLTIDGDDKGSRKDEIKGKSDDKKIGHRDVVIKKGNDQLALGEGNLIQIIGGGHLIEVEKNQSVYIKANQNIIVSGNIAIHSMGDAHIKAKNLVVEAEESMSFKAGKDIMMQSTGGSINFDASEKILCKGAEGVGLTGGSSTIDLSANAGIKGGSNVVIKGKKVDINGGAPDEPKPPKPAESAEEAVVESATDLEKATISAALKENEKITKKGGKPEDKIKFSDLK
jgi:type VI secretion system secreted protein VgrG